MISNIVCKHKTAAANIVQKGSNVRGNWETSRKHNEPLSKEGQGRDVSGDRRHRVADFYVGYVSTAPPNTLHDQHHRLS
jgi:hypothetical protein